MQITIDLDVLKAEESELYQELLNHDYKLRGKGEVTLDTKNLSHSLGIAIVAFAHDRDETQQAAALAKAKAESEEQDKAATLAEQAKKDEAEAVRRLYAYAGQHGLERSQHNHDLITAFIREHTKNEEFPNGYFSAVAVDAAIQCLGPRGENKWRWVTPAATPPPPPPETPMEPVVTNRDLRNMSAEEAKAWLRGERKRTGHNYFDTLRRKGGDIR